MSYGLTRVGAMGGDTDSHHVRATSSSAMITLRGRRLHQSCARGADSSARRSQAGAPPQSASVPITGSLTPKITASWSESNEKHALGVRVKLSRATRHAIYLAQQRSGRREQVVQA
jgi:hypothetical protein